MHATLCLWHSPELLLHTTLGECDIVHHFPCTFPAALESSHFQGICSGINCSDDRTLREICYEHGYCHLVYI